MKQLIIILMISIFAVATVSADSIDNECDTFGFDSGVAKWKCGGGTWTLDEGLDSTSVTGSCSAADWDAGNSGADGIIVKAGSTVYYSVDGTNGQVTQHRPNISHITFCANAQEIPEFGTITAAIALLGSGIGFLFLRRRY